MELGRHALADIYGCNNALLDDIDKIKDILISSCKEANLTVVETTFHKFKPIGISGVIVLAESHITIHTWPEYNFVAIDAFTCGSHMNPNSVCKIIAQKLGSNNIKLNEYKRGVSNE
jgi:S-adenosylmethionine decarboxylase